MMKKWNLSPSTGHTLCLTGLLTVLALAVIVTKALMPAYILPRITITALVALSLAAMVLERWLFGSTRTDYLETGLLSAAAFAVLAWAVGFAALPGAGRVGIAGGLTYTICRVIFNAMSAQLDSTGVKHKRAVLTLAAALLLLASQSLAGLPILG